MSGTGSYITYGVLMLILVPVVMISLGEIFVDDTITAKEDYRIGEDTTALTQLRADGSARTAEVVFPWSNSSSSTSDSNNALYDGFSIFPWWFNVILVTIPIVLIARGVLSISA